MKRISKNARWLALLLVAVTTTACQSQETPASVETDPRLHSDGNGWKLDQAVITDRKLPRVLLIGDSILGGYQKFAIEELKNKAYVDTWGQPYHQGYLQGEAKTWKAMVDGVMSKGPYDFVLFNMGLHGFQPGRIPEGQFKPLTEKLVASIREKAPRAKLFWLSTTPITEADPRPDYAKLGPPEKPYGLNSELNPIIIEHNRLAAEVMKEADIPVVDFYSALAPHLDWARGDMFHWKEPAYRLLAKNLVQTLQPELQKKPADN